METLELAQPDFPASIDLAVSIAQFALPHGIVLPAHVTQVSRKEEALLRSTPVNQRL